MASIKFASEEAELANTLPANLDDLYDYLTEAGEVSWRPVVPDSSKGAVKQVSTEAQKPESPLNKVPPASAAPVKAAPKKYFFFQAEDGIRDLTVTGVQTCALPI